MQKEKAGLVLEGGGMRGVFTAGVLDFFLDRGISFDSCYGVSAGACHACSFLSGQRGRALAVNVDYLQDWHYCSFRSLLLTGDIFGAKFAYHDIPERLNPYDYEAFDRNPCEFYAVLTDCVTGKAVYYPVTDLHRDIEAVRASSSLPLLSRMVEIQGRKYLDGGVADSIPLAHAMADGCTRSVVVLTQHPGYRKKPNAMMPLIRARYRRYPALVAGMADRHLRYNQTLELVKAREAAGNVFVLQPSRPVELKRIERNREKLLALYEEGFRTAEEAWPRLREFLAAGRGAACGSGDCRG